MILRDICPSTLDTSDWKVLTEDDYMELQQTAKSFINNCLMVLVSQKKLELQPEDQRAMDQRIRTTLLPNPEKTMECNVWAASKAKGDSAKKGSDGYDNDKTKQEKSCLVTPKTHMYMLCSDFAPLCPPSTEWQKLGEVNVLVLDCSGLFKDDDLHKVTAVITDIAGVDSPLLNHWLSKPRHVYYLINKACNAISYMHHRRGKKSDHVHLHANNCPRQNKNNYFVL